MRFTESLAAHIDFVMAHGISRPRQSSESGFELSLANRAIGPRRGSNGDCCRRRGACSPIRSSTSATISLAVVDDPTIHALNRQFLEHD